MNEILNCFEIKDSAIDLDEIRKAVAQGIEQRRDYALNHSIDIEQLTQPVNLNDMARNWTLELIEHHKATLLLKPYVIPPGQGIFGHFAAWLKRQAHNLVIYYVNLSGRKQILFNESVAEALALYQAKIENLQEKVIWLEDKIQRLEAQVASKEAKEYE